jgi:hypothetical protein
LNEKESFLDSLFAGYEPILKYEHIAKDNPRFKIPHWKSNFHIKTLRENRMFESLHHEIKYMRQLKDRKQEILAYLRSLPKI